MGSPSTIEDPELYKFREVYRENSQANIYPAQPENAQEDADDVNKALQSPGSHIADTWSGIWEDPVLPDDDTVEYSDAVKLTAEILRKQACNIGERTDRAEKSEMTENEQEGEATKDDRNVNVPLHEPKKETAASKRLLTKRKRREQTRSAQKEAQKQRKRR